MQVSVRISYIIPIFNGEKYLGQCLDSLYKQGLSEEEFEVICVDDCSQDSSVAILKSYAIKHPNVKLILHESNKKTGTSLNDALQIANGDYVWVLGQDDWLETGSGKRLVKESDDNALDLLCFNYNRVNATGGKVLSKVQVFENSQVMDGKCFIHKYFENTFCAYLLGYEWRAIYNRKYLSNQGIMFPNGVIYEDSTFLFKAMWNSKCMKSTDGFVYNYRLNDNSVTDVTKRYKGYQTYEFAFVAGTEVMELSKSTTEKNLAEQLCQQALRYYKSFSYKVIPMCMTEKKVFYSNVRENGELVKRCLAFLPWYYSLLANPSFGGIVAQLLYPAFFLKHLFKKHSYISY